MQPQTFPVCVYERLFATAERLQWQWRNLELSDTFDSRMIEAVLRHLTRYPVAPGTSEEDLCHYACLLLRKFWHRNARRDYVRLMQARAQSKSPEVHSLDFLQKASAYEPPVQLYSRCGRSEDAGELGQAVVQQLVVWGTPRKWAWAVVWRASGRTLDDVAYLMDERFQCGPISLCTLKSWDRRTYPKAMSRLRKAFGADKGRSRK